MQFMFYFSNAFALTKINALNHKTELDKHQGDESESEKLKNVKLQDIKRKGIQDGKPMPRLYFTTGSPV